MFRSRDLPATADFSLLLSSKGHLKSENDKLKVDWCLRPAVFHPNFWPFLGVKRPYTNKFQPKNRRRRCIVAHEKPIYLYVFGKLPSLWTKIDDKFRRKKPQGVATAAFLHILEVHRKIRAYRA